MEDGSVLNRLKSNLDTDENYETSTPNATMSVRGTVYRVTVYVGEDGLKYTKLEVLDGKVEVALKTEDGEFNGVVETFSAGEAALIRGNSEFSEFVIGEDGEIIREIEYSELPKVTAEKLVEFADDGEVYAISKELLMDYTSLAEHKIEEKVLVESDCENPGEVERFCSVCGEEREVVEVPPNGHKEGKWVVAKAATCTEVGREENHCADCDKVIKTREIPVAEHTAGEWVVIEEATCTETGTEEQRCTACDKVIANRVIQVTGHQAGEWITIKEATCKETGIEEQRCVTCNKELGSRQIAKKPHVEGKHEIVKGQEATCTDAGSERIRCAVCNEIISIKEVLPTGHKSGEWTTVKEATCTDAGEQQKICSVCDAVVDTREIKALGHTFTEWTTVKEATCTEEGKEEHKCSVCNEIVETRAISASGHKGGEWKIVKEATCTEEGKKEQYCTVCDTFIKSEIIEKADHVLEDWVTVKASTCIERGNAAQSCSVCNNVVNTRMLELAAHIGGEWLTVKDSTCVQRGTKERRCTTEGCDAVVETGVVELKAHTAAAEWTITKDSTCIAEGEKVKYCTTEGCDAVVETGVVELKAHTAAAEWTVTKDSTCIVEGEKVKYCTTEGCTAVVETEIVPLKAHVGGEWEIETDSTCTTEGKQVKKCTTEGCDAVVATEIVPLQDHTLGEWTTVTASTCTVAGTQEQKCTVCNNVINTENLPLAAHTESWTTVTEPTCTQAGTKKGKCSVCDYSYGTAEIPALGHSWIHEQGIEMAGDSTWYMIASCERTDCEFNTQSQQHILEDNASGTALDCITCGAKSVHTHNLVKYHYTDGGSYEEISCSESEDGSVVSCGKTTSIAVQFKHICSELPTTDVVTDSGVVPIDVICSNCSESILASADSTSGTATEHAISAMPSSDGGITYVCYTCGELEEGSLIVNAETDATEFFVFGQDTASGEYKVAGISQSGYDQLMTYDASAVVSLTLPETYTDEGGVVHTVTDFAYNVNSGTENQLVAALSSDTMPYQEWIIPAGYDTFTGFSGSDALSSSTVVKLKNIDFGNVTSIANGALANVSAIERVDISASVTDIGANAFSNCTSLSELKIAEGFAGTIGTNAFSNSAIKDVTLPTSMTSINNNAFGDSSETSSLEIIRWNVNHTDVTSSSESALPHYPVIRFADGNYMQCGEGAEKCIAQTNDGVTATVYSGDVAFGANERYAYETINVADGVESIVDYMFENCSATSIVLPYTLQTIGEKAFASSKITSIYIPYTVEKISNDAFAGCVDLVSITFEDGFTGTIGDYVFEGCTGLTDIVIPKGTASIGNNVFNNCTSLSSVTFEKEATGGDAFVGSVGEDLFVNCPLLTSVAIPTTMTNLSAMFRGSDITSVIIPATVDTIADYAFKGCEDLTSVTFEEGFAGIIGNEAFEGCISLPSVIIPSGVQVINADAFSNCTSLSSVTLEEGFVGERQFYLFMNCPLLRTVNIPSSMTTLGSIFANSDITSIEIPNTITFVDAYALSYCEDLTTVTFEEGFKGTISTYVFEGCTSLSSVVFEGVTYTDNATLKAALEAAGISCSSDFFVETVTN